MYGLKTDWLEEASPRYFTLSDFEGAVARPVIPPHRAAPVEPHPRLVRPVVHRRREGARVGKKKLGSWPVGRMHGLRQLDVKTLDRGQHRRNQLLARRKVREGRGHGDAGLAGQLGVAGRGDAPAREHPRGARQQLGPTRLGREPGGALARERARIGGSSGFH